MATGDFDPRLTGHVWSDAYGWILPTGGATALAPDAEIAALRAAVEAQAARIAELEAALRETQPILGRAKSDALNATGHPPDIQRRFQVYASNIGKTLARIDAALAGKE